MIDPFNAINRKPSMTTVKHYPHAPGKGPQTAAECDFAHLLLDYERLAGERAVRALVERMTGASDRGCYREDHVRMVRAALAAMPTRH